MTTEPAIGTKTRRPIGIWVITVLAALFALAQLVRLFDAVLLPDDSATMMSVPEFGFRIAAFLLAAIWSVLTFKAHPRAALFGMLFFACSLLPFIVLAALLVEIGGDADVVQEILPYALLWCAFVLSLALWTKRLVTK
jgi:hypothetical protein